MTQIIHGDKFQALVEGAFCGITPTDQYKDNDIGHLFIRGAISFRHSDIDSLIEFLKLVRDRVAFCEAYLLPHCPLCKTVKLDIDTQAMMEDYGEHWELVLRNMDRNMAPYKCPGCKQEGTYEDFRLMAKLEGGAP